MQILRAKIKKACDFTLDNILPARCVVTGEPVIGQGALSSAAWGRLDFIADPKCACCGMPFEYGENLDIAQDHEQTQKGGLHCMDCLKFPPPYKSARAPLLYNDNSRNLILGFKHGDKMHSVKAFTPWLMRAGEDMLNNADILVPVPLHYLRLVKRRYNQSALIASDLSKHTRIRHIPDMLLRTRSTPPQGRLKHKERRNNVKQAFLVKPSKAGILKGKKIILIDDVYTTGATVKECTRVLLKSGASTVHILTVARVKNPRF